MQLRRTSWIVMMGAAAVAFIVAGADAQRRDAFSASRNHRAIAYSILPVHDAVAALNRRLQDGSARLRFEPVSGYLPSVLEALDVPVASQTLVFSQTSLQGPKISMRNPRAIYFNDTVAVGWVRGGDALEVAALDPRQGVVFYALDQTERSRPQFRRDDTCLACHLSWDTLAVPGLMVQSVHPLRDERSYVVGYTTIQGSPYEQRWGGWWVTGDHGGARHLGNVPVMPADMGTSRLANPTAVLPTVEGQFDVSGYLSAHSDVVALLVLAHQTRMTNLITRAGWEARVAEAEPGADARARVDDAARELVDYMLFVYEAPLAGPVRGSSDFAQAFAARGPRDRLGRSLREFDLRTRLFRYPLSYMIYTDAFDALPPMAKDRVYDRLWAILAGELTEPKYDALTPTVRGDILEILRDTKTDLPAKFTG